MPRIWKDKNPTQEEPEKNEPAEIAEDEAPVGREPLYSRLKKPFRSSRAFFWCALILAVVLAFPAVYRRLGVEWSHRVTSILVDYKDITSLANQAGEDRQAVYTAMAERGVRGITVAEFTGKDLAGGAMPFLFSSLGSIDPAYRTGVTAPLGRAAFLVDSSYPRLPLLMEYLRMRMPDVAKYVPGKQTLIVLPFSFDELGDSGIVPDFDALDFVEKNKVAAVYRPQPALGIDGEKAAASLMWLKRRYPSISCVLPAGQMIVGYPQIAPLAAVLKEHSISVGQAEFVRQIGVHSLFASMNPEILSLHSLTREELISRRLSRAQVVERMVRAVHERSVRLLLMRPYDLYSVEKLPTFLDDLQKIHDSLRGRGYSFGWPRTLPKLTSTLASALALALVFMASFWSYARRYIGSKKQTVSKIEAIIFAVLVLIVGLSVWKISAVGKLLGGLTAAFVAAEATIWALDRYNKPFEGLIAGLLIVVSGGLVIAAFYGTTSAMLRLTPFSGVKLTLLLPPLMVLANDMRKRVHPESLAEIMQRPPLWGELVLVGVFVVAAMVLTLRSDNFAFVPGWEARFRDFLERLLWVRPRTKEFLIGYPCLILYYSFVRGGVASHYREIFRIGASLAYASAINTFCHFHTLLPLTVIRVVNGWWLGILLGFVLLVTIDYVGGPIWRRGGRELFR